MGGKNTAESSNIFHLLPGLVQKEAVVFAAAALFSLNLVPRGQE